ncbi:MAG: anti-sigma factor antagonist [Spirochaetes bacterium]|nr:anti-sigma factor antagonist [Spirochaetota bacterium]
MILRTKNIGNATVVNLHGRLDLFEAEQVEKDLFEIAESTRDNHMIIVLEGLDYLSSSGLRIFISLRRFLNLSGRRLLLCNKNNNAVNIFLKIINIKDMLTLYKTEEEAILQCGGGKKTRADKIA